MAEEGALRAAAEEEEEGEEEGQGSFRRPLLWGGEVAEAPP